MQFDSQRAFPYPVLRPDVNDYLDGEFQAIVDLAYPEGGSNFQLQADFALSVDEITETIKKGIAKFVLVLSCRDTYWRHVIQSKKTKIFEQFPVGVLRSEVQIFPYIIAQKTISQFTCPLINPEFGNGPFSFEKGAVLAIDEPTAVYVDRDLFRPITSIFELVVKEHLRGAEWHLDCSDDQVRIGLSSQMKAKIDGARNNSRNKAILLNSLYFAAVMQCVRHLSDPTYETRRWAEIIRQKCLNLGLSIGGLDEYLIAERLLKHPLGLLDTYVFRESEE